MALDFPSSPTLNQVFGNYTWDGEKWKQTATATPVLPGGRLTLSSGAPIMTATVAAGTTMYWTPYLGSRVPLYNGAAWVVQSAAEISVLTTNTTKNPAAIGASKVNDWFLWDDAGTLRLSHGPDWTNDTTRSAGTALTMVDGIWLNNAAIANACAASRGTYVGTTKSEAANSIAWTLGGTGNGGVAAKLNVWNMYNRVNITPGVYDNSTSWSYNAATVRPMNNSSTNSMGFVSGLAEEAIHAQLFVKVTVPAAVNAAVGISLDSTVSFTGSRFNFAASSASVPSDGTGTAIGVFLPQLGYHVLYALELGNATAITFQGGSATQGQGLTSLFRM